MRADRKRGASMAQERERGQPQKSCCGNGLQPFLGGLSLIPLTVRWRGIAPPQPKVIYQTVRRRKSFAKRFAALALFLVVFAGILFATHNYLRGRGVLPEINNPFAAKPEAVALMDINLRSEPNKNADQIGLITKDSRIRISDTDGNWYKIAVVEQGSQPSVPTATEGWISGKSKNGDDTIKLSR